uniref:Ulp1 protease family, C-terminal catalytic domain-containing protein n=1 Tax=Tanacetum cinerariifolium TaxID=118510 RepID=A0A6L2J5E8_TANCI|nr:ulp1 protease family, C-terminal catalytic domain-containing protein [Tanacetum cinerariifolium]
MSVDVSSLSSCVPDPEFTESSIQMDNVNALVKKQPTPAAKTEATGTQLAETETHGQSTKRQQFRDPPTERKKNKATKALNAYVNGVCTCQGQVVVPWSNERPLKNKELNAIIGAWFTLWRD